jgi:hypothetical protein
MDVREASAMTEASGLTNDQDGLENPSRGRVSHGKEADPRPAARFAEQLRKVTVEAPLRSLFLAFLLGVWVARRR